MFYQGSSYHTMVKAARGDRPGAGLLPHTEESRFSRPASNIIGHLGFDCLVQRLNFRRRRTIPLYCLFHSPQSLRFLRKFGLHLRKHL